MLTTLREKERLLMMSNLSFYHNVSKVHCCRGVRKCLYVEKGYLKYRWNSIKFKLIKQQTACDTSASDYIWKHYYAHSNFFFMTESSSWYVWIKLKVNYCDILLSGVHCASSVIHQHLQKASSQCTHYNFDFVSILFDLDRILLSMATERIKLLTLSLI